MVICPSLERTDDILQINDLRLWSDLYLQNCIDKLYKECTVEHYRTALKRFGIWHSDRLKEGVLTKRKAGDFAFWLGNVKRRFDDHPDKPTEDSNLSPATVRRTIGVVRTFFTWLYDEGYLPRDFSGWFPFPPIRQIPKKVVSASTLAALFHGAVLGDMAVRDSAMIALLADTGLRRAEIVKITLKQVEWLDEENRGCISNVVGKGDRLRVVPFSPIVGTLLREWLHFRSRILQDFLETPLLFLTPEGGALLPGAIYQILRRCARRAGVEDEVWNTHSLRHNFATHFWRIQRDTKTLSLILGHSSQKITEDIYVHAVPQDLLDAHTSVFVTGHVQVPAIQQARQLPTKDELRTAIQTTPNWIALGKQFGMSDVGVRKLATRLDVLDIYYQAKDQATA